MTTQHSKCILAFQKIHSEIRKKTSKHCDWLKPLGVNIWPVSVWPLGSMRRCNRRCHPPVNLSCFVVWDCRQSPATPQTLAVYSLVLHMLAISHHGPFSEYELTAENEPPSLFHSLARQEAVPAAVLEHQTPAQGLLSCSGTFGWRWWVESQHWRSHYTVKAAVIPLF